MKSIILALAVGSLSTFSAMLYFENEKLIEENQRLTTVAVNVQDTNRKFEASLISCRHTVDGFVARSQETLVHRMMTDTGRFSYLKAQDFPKVAKVSGLEAERALFQAER
jgi:hypothetical protein